MLIFQARQPGKTGSADAESHSALWCRLCLLDCLRPLTAGLSPCTLPTHTALPPALFPRAQKGERLSPYQYKMYHNKTIAEATLRSYTAPLLTFLPEATWREDVDKVLQAQLVPTPIVVAHFAQDAPEIAALKEAAMSLRGLFRFYVAPPAAGARHRQPPPARAARDRDRPAVVVGR